jgi:hypothetical protein
MSADWTVLHRYRSTPDPEQNGQAPVTLTIWRDRCGGVILGISQADVMVVLMAIPPEERAALAVAILAGGPRMEPST